jgi:hypothetical protein
MTILQQPKPQPTTPLINALRDEIAAARRKLADTWQSDERNKIDGYIAGLQCAMFLEQQAGRVAELDY